MIRLVCRVRPAVDMQRPTLTCTYTLSPCVYAHARVVPFQFRLAHIPFSNVYALSAELLSSDRGDRVWFAASLRLSLLRCALLPRPPTLWWTYDYDYDYSSCAISLHFASCKTAPLSSLSSHLQMRMQHRLRSMAIPCPPAYLPIASNAVRPSIHASSVLVAFPCATSFPPHSARF